MVTATFPPNMKEDTMPDIDDRLQAFARLTLPERPRSTELAFHGCTFDDLLAFARSAGEDWTREANESDKGTVRWLRLAPAPHRALELGIVSVVLFLGIEQDVPSLPPTFVQVVERKLAELKFIEVTTNA